MDWNKDFMTALSWAMDLDDLVLRGGLFTRNSATHCFLENGRARVRSF